MIIGKWNMLKSREVSIRFFIFVVASTLGCTSTITDSKLGEIANRNQPIVEKKIEVDSNGEILENHFPNQFTKIASGIFFADLTYAWSICGRSESLCATVDGGKSWQVVNNKDIKPVLKFFFIDPKTGFAVSDLWNNNRRSNTILKTPDGGKTWKEVLQVPSPIYSVVFSNQTNGVVSARWLPLYVTKDAGQTWQEAGKEPNNENEFLAVNHGVKYIAFLSEKKVVGYGDGIWSSVDLGRTWENEVDSGATEGGVFGASFVDENNGWIVGGSSQLWRMTDGNKWERVEVPENLLEGDKKQFTFYRASFINANEGWISCHNSFPRDISVGKILHTINSGKTWETVYESSDQLGDIKFLDSKKGFALNNARDLLRTLDGGKTWSLQPIVNSTD
ncbi:MAG: WD40/YVTN/BNR-like repeat-containing protein [Pyrinomonadaceae bacterium]